MFSNSDSDRDCYWQLVIKELGNVIWSITKQSENIIDNLEKQSASKEGDAVIVYKSVFARLLHWV